MYRATNSPWLMVSRVPESALAIVFRARAADVWASFLNQPIEVLALRPRLGEAISHAGFPQLLLRMG